MPQVDVAPRRGAGPAPARSVPILKILLGIAVVVALVLLGRQAGGYIVQFSNWVESLGAWGPLVFILGYAVATVALVPGSLLTLAAGALFGIVWGTAYVFVGAMLGAMGAFLIARYVARAPVERRLAGNPRFAAVDRAIGGEGRKIVFLLRLSPVVPFVFLNYCCGLTRVSFRDYAVGSVGMLPGTLLYVYFGKVAGDLVAALSGGAQQHRGAAYYAVLALGLVATIAVTTIVTRTARRALKEATDARDDL